MSFGVTVVCLMAMQQLAVAPYPGTAGRPVLVSAQREGAPLAGVEFVVETPVGTSRPVGATDREGNLRFVPEVAGDHVFVAIIDGVRHLVPLAVRESRGRWPLVGVSVSLGLALLWWNLSRARGRRGP